MNIYIVRKSEISRFLSSPLAAVMILALLFWATGLPSLLHSADAAQLTDISDTLSNSNYGALSSHTIKFTATNAISPSQTIKISLDPSGTSPGTSAFTEAFSAATSSDFTFQAGATPYSVVNACSSGNQVSAVGNYNNGSDENLTLTVCPGAAAIATSSVVTIVEGAVGTNLWTNPNPGTPTSYVIRIGGSMSNSGDTRIATIANVTVTAAIDTTFTFTVSGTTTGSTINGTTTSTSTTATAINFGTLVPGTPVKAGQDLFVSTNAKNGFVVTVQEDQPLTSSSGAYIPLFDNGASTTAPIAWAAPSGTLDQPWTYSHIGVTSNDSNLSTDTGSANDDFSGTGFSGGINQPRPVFAHTGPSDGKTGSKGTASVLYEIQISPLQAAGNDYTNKLTYVATPTF